MTLYESIVFGNDVLVSQLGSLSRFRSTFILLSFIVLVDNQTIRSIDPVYQVCKCDKLRGSYVHSSKLERDCHDRPGSSWTNEDAILLPNYIGYRTHSI